MNDLENSIDPIERAQELTTVQQPLPSFFNPLFRNQGGVNRALIAAVQTVLYKQSQQEIRSDALEANLHEQIRIGNERNTELQTIREFSRSWISTLQGSVEDLQHSRSALISNVEALRVSIKEEGTERDALLERIEQQLDETKDKFEIDLSTLSSSLAQLSSEIAQLKESKMGILESLSSVEIALEGSNGRSDKIEASIDSLVKNARAHDEALKRFSAEVNTWQSETKVKSTETEEDLKNSINKIEKSLNEHSGNVEQSISQLEREFISASQNLKRSIAQARSTNAFVRPPNGNTESPTIEKTISRAEFDDFYKQFEDQFRGTRESVFEKQSRHLDIVKDTLNVPKNRPKLDVLDLGCGRGEWLELVGNANLKNRGVDQNATFIKQCIGRELDVVEAGAIEFLSGLDNNSCGAVTAFHLIEHLSFAELWLLYEQVIRVLVPGGVGIFETPNPNNLRVASHFFLTDITHVRPVPPSLAVFLATYHGAKKAEIQQYHPFPEAEKHANLPMEVNDAIYGPQDYSVVFYK